MWVWLSRFSGGQCSEVTVFLSPSKMLSLHLSVPGTEPEFSTRQDRVQAIRCCSDLEGNGQMGDGQPLGPLAARAVAVTSR